MKIITSVRKMQAWADKRRAAGRRIALVPTMGALHAGHEALVREALSSADDVAVSIFVNPTQFVPGEDFEVYPRPFEKDVNILAALSPDVVAFAPGPGEMYPEGLQADRMSVSVGALSRHLCGAFRPGHFDGVATVVLKLFHACRPDVAVFGLKDAQQFVILRRLAQDMLLGIEVVGVPTVRDADGLAFSSRNAYLSPGERKAAAVVPQAVHAAAEAIGRGEQRGEALVEIMRSIVRREAGARVEYAEVVDADTLQPTEAIRPGQRVLAAVAAFFGTTRLIDSVFAQAPVAMPEPVRTS